MHDRSHLPDAFDVLERFDEDSLPLCIFLDYDGTLSPIVERPEDAVLSPDMRDILERVAARHRTAVISGRGLTDLLDRVGVENIFYAGSHGFELRHPSGELTSNEAAATAAARLDDLVTEFETRLADVAGSQLELKRFGLAVHYRRVADADVPTVIEAVEAVRALYPELALKTGKKVFEFVPALDWNKGKAIAWIMNSAGLGRGTTYPIFIGDDVTDEDAFHEIDDWGLAVAVGEDGPASTYATFKLTDVEAVGRFLAVLAEMP